MKLLSRSIVVAALVTSSACSFGPPATRVPVQRPDDRLPPVVDPGQPPEVESRLPPPTMEKLPPPEVVGPEDNPVQAPPQAQSQPTASPAVVALLETAREQAAQGQDEQAAANLERALRIEPKNPWLWHRLGVLRLQQGNYQAAIDLARKSNSLAAGDRRLLAGNWELLARAYTALGNPAAAESARQKARELSVPVRG